jgi:hypothetical protein
MGIKIKYQVILILVYISVLLGACTLLGAQESDKDVEVDCNELAAIFIDQDPNSF